MMRRAVVSMALRVGPDGQHLAVPSSPTGCGAARIVSFVSLISVLLFD
jgi:hypothetical protein